MSVMFAGIFWVVVSLGGLGMVLTSYEPIVFLVAEVQAIILLFLAVLH